jgi:Domain of unknown function (DUF4214)
MFMATASEQITQLYVGYFDRAPDLLGLNYWIGQFNGGMGLLEIAQSFSVQSETRASYSFLAVPSVGSADGFLDSVYRNLFNRTIDAEGLSYWKGELTSGKPVGRVIVDIISGAQGADKIIVDNKTSVAQFYVTRLADSPGDNFRLGDARQVLDNVNATSASVTSAQELTLSLLRENLTLTFNDPQNLLMPFETAIRASVHAAWDMWEIYFTRHAPVELEINVFTGAGTTLASAGSRVTQSTGEFDAGRRVFQVGVAYELATGIDPNGEAPDAEISISPNLSQFAFRASVQDPLPAGKFDAITVFAHEIGHVLGFNSGSRVIINSVNTFDRYVTGTGSPVFTGPAAMAANGGVPVALDPGSRSHLAESSDLMAANLVNGQFRPVEPLHIAMLQDTGLPVSLLGIDGVA